MSYTLQEIWKRKICICITTFSFLRRWVDYVYRHLTITFVLVLCPESIFGRQRIIIELIGESFIFLVSIVCRKTGVAWKWHIPLSSVLPPGSSLGAEFKLTPICHYVLVSRWSLCLFPKLTWNVHVLFYIERTWEYNSKS